MVIVSLLMPLAQIKAETITSRLKGRILLQVEERGEAWYVEPIAEERIFLGRPDDAFKVMRELGLGISEKDFNTLEQNALRRLSGRIILRVEAKGEAYYINPVDVKIYFLGAPVDAFSLMRDMGLGATNQDIDNVPISQKYGQQEISEKIIIKNSEEVLQEQNNETNESNKEPVKVVTPTFATCNSWVYSNWSDCQLNGIQSRIVLRSIPVNCINGSPVLIRSCDYEEEDSIDTSFDYQDFKKIFTIRRIRITGENEILYDAIYNGQMGRESFWAHFSSFSNDLKIKYAEKLAKEIRDDSSVYSAAIDFKYINIRLGYAFAYPPDDYHANGYELSHFTKNPFLLSL